MSNFRLSQRSINNLAGVNPALVSVVNRAIEITSVDFAVIEGMRTPERQRELYAKRLTQTLNSKHLIGSAVDCAPFIGGQIPWNDKSQFKAVSDAMFAAARELGVAIRWGRRLERERQER